MAGLIPEKSGESYAIQCFPLYSLLLATGKSPLHFATLKNYLSFTTSKPCYKVVNKNEKEARLQVGLTLGNCPSFATYYFDVLFFDYYV
jgi:hypothetical protein